MIKNYTLIIAAWISLSLLPLFVNAKDPVNYSGTIQSTETLNPTAKLINFKGGISGKKIILQWEVERNETANLFEVQKSIDGKSFEMTAMVFGTDKPDTDNYIFYEKAGIKNTSYRIKLINKNKEPEYSSVIVISASKTN